MSKYAARTQQIAVGALGGLAAAWIMNQFQSVFEQLSSSGDEDGKSKEEPTTVKAADKIALLTAGAPVPKDDKAVAGEIVHYGFGALLGATYGAIGSRIPEIRAGFGTGYGAAAALLADEALVPAAGLSPPPTETSLGNHVFGFVSHLVFGAALEGSRRLLTAILDHGRYEPATARTAP